MFKTLQKSWPEDKDFPARTFRLSILTRVLNGTLYDNLKYAFHEEKNDAGEYIKMRERRPSVRYNMCRMVVDDSVALLFSEGHFPEIDAGADGEQIRESLARLIKESNLNQVLIEAATRGSVGSIAILFRVLSDRIFFDVMETVFITPTWKADAPDTLDKVTEKYKSKGRDLIAAGYDISADDLDADFWFMREWDAENENWYLPQKIEAEKKAVPPKIDKDRTVNHALGFVPVVWVKNLPGGDQIDGNPTFSDEAIETGIEIDYQLSQAGRGLKYSSDPTLLIKEPSFNDGTIVRSASNAIKVNADGDAKLLEINGTAVEAVMNYVRMLRELALENMHGNRANADKISAAQSGRAMELMNQALIWLADRLRISYGEGALLSLLNMIVAAADKFNLIYKDKSKVGKLVLTTPLALRWSPWYQPTATDLSSTANTLKTMIDSGIISRKTAVKVIAAQFDIEDIDAELALIKAEMAEREAAAQKTVAIQE
ncbi:MAG: phage portal protein [Thiobacillus sp.]